MTEPIIELQSTLKRHRQSFTGARRQVFLALQGQEPQTMRNIVQTCRGRVDRASVYRTIALYEHLGIVQRLQIGWKYKLELSDRFSRHHHHLTCSRCGHTTPLPGDHQLETRLQALARRQGFRPEAHQVEIRGLCQACTSPSEV